MRGRIEVEGDTMANDDKTVYASDVDQGILRLLGHRYGDGLVYLESGSEQRLLTEAVRRGLVTAEGYVTPRGLSLLALHGDD